jgi:hypothetical protein
MPKHNKKRNTAFLYEALIREIVKQTLKKDVVMRNKIINTLKESFSPKKELGKELLLFKTLLETRGVSIRIGEKLIQETKKEYKKLDEKKVFSEQSTLIKKINKEISRNVFSNFVPNYKDIANLSQMFGEDVGVKHRVVLEERVLSVVSSDLPKEIKNDKINNLVVNKFIGRYNNHYKKELIESQKQLLNKYILSFLDNGVDFQLYLNEEIHRLKKTVQSAYDLEELKNDKTMFEKMKKVYNILETCSQKPIDKEMIENVLKVQLLATEVEN